MNIDKAIIMVLVLLLTSFAVAQTETEEAIPSFEVIYADEPKSPCETSNGATTCTYGENTVSYSGEFDGSIEEGDKGEVAIKVNSGIATFEVNGEPVALAAGGEGLKATPESLSLLKGSHAVYNGYTVNNNDGTGSVSLKGSGDQSVQMEEGESGVELQIEGSGFTVGISSVTEIDSVRFAKNGNVKLTNGDRTYTLDGDVVTFDPNEEGDPNNRKNVKMYDPNGNVVPEVSDWESSISPPEGSREAMAKTASEHLDRFLSEELDTTDPSDPLTQFLETGKVPDGEPEFPNDALPIRKPRKDEVGQIGTFETETIVASAQTDARPKVRIAVTQVDPEKVVFSPGGDFVEIDLTKHPDVVTGTSNFIDITSSTGTVDGGGEAIRIRLNPGIIGGFGAVDNILASTIKNQWKGVVEKIISRESAFRAADGGTPMSPTEENEWRAAARTIVNQIKPEINGHSISNYDIVMRDRRIDFIPKEGPTKLVFSDMTSFEAPSAILNAFKDEVLERTRTVWKIERSKTRTTRATTSGWSSDAGKAFVKD